MHLKHQHHLVVLKLLSLSARALHSAVLILLGPESTRWV